MAEQILYSLKIEGTQTELERLAAINDEINKGKENLKELAKSDKQAAEQQKLTLKEQQSEYRELQKSIERRNKAEEQGINTLEKMRAKLSLLYKELDQTEIGSERFKEITVQANKLRNEIGKAEEASGRFQRNVGNYQNAIQDAFQAMGVNVAGLTQNLASANSVIQLTTAITKGMTAATGGLTGALKVLKVALISTGVGALVVALGAAIALLVNALKSFDPLIDKIEQGVAALKAVFGSLSDTVLSVVTGQKSFKDAVNGAGDAMRRSAAAAIEYKKAQQDLDDAVFKATVTQEKYKNQIAELLLQSKNRTLSEQERIELIDKALEIEQKAFNERKAIADQELSIAQGAIITKNNLTNEEIDNLKRLGVEYAIALKERKSVTDEQVQALADAQAKQLQLEGESISLREKALNRRDQLEDAANEKALKRAEDQRKITLEQIALQRLADQYAIDAIQALLSLKEEIADDPELVIFRFPTEEEIEDQSQVLVDQLQQRADEGLKLIEDFNEQSKGLYDQDIANLQAAYSTGLINAEQYEAGKLELRKQYNEAILAETADLLNQLAEIFGKESKAGKAAAIAATAINTYVTAMEAFKSGVKYGGPIGIPLGIAAAAVATAFGVKQIQQIAATKQEKQPRYASGVIGVRGAGSETSDSIDAKISRGESVMTAKATKVFAPVLAQMEQAVGNTPNVQIGSGRFANGIINLSPRTEFPQNYERIIKRTIEAVGNIPVVVAESDITGTQNRVRRIKVAGDL